MATASTADKTDQRLYLLVGLVALGGGAAIGISLAQVLTAAPEAEISWAGLVALIVLVAVGERLVVEVRVRSTGHGVNWADVAVLIGLAVAPAPWVVVATAGGVLVAKTLRRTRPLKLAFGTAKEAVVAGVGGLVLIWLGSPGSLAAPLDIGPLALAFLAMTVVDELLAIPVIALASRTAVQERFTADLDIRLAAVVGRYAVAALAVLALRWQPQLLYTLPLVVLFLYFWQERWVRARQERQAWQNLARATEAFSGVDLDHVLRAAVTRGTKLFAPDAMEVEIWSGSLRRLVRGGPNEIAYDGDPDAAPPDSKNVYAVALHGYPGQQDIGAVRLRFRDRVKVSGREQAMLLTYAAALDTAVRNAVAYGRLGAATAAHAHAAAHDPLTGLANRRELARQLTEALERPDHDRSLGLILLDLRHFKEVNDTLGHLAGDRVLQRVAQRLVTAAGPDDLVARFGGDEFAILLRTAGPRPEASSLAKQLISSLSEPVDADGLPIVVEAAAGLAVAADLPGPAGDPAGPAPAELMRRADVALYQAKRTGQALICYREERGQPDRDRLALSGQLARAVARREFVLRFQPIVDLGSGAVLGAEALARWRHPDRGELPPQFFLDLLERSSQLPEFTAAVLDDALTAADMWRAAGHDLSVSVNISARSLLDRNLPRQVFDALQAHRTGADRLCLELTETLAISQLEVVDHVLGRLRDIGVRLALDDFGTGFSSLAVLSRVPVQQLKVDRSFISAMRAGTDSRIGSASQARAVVRSTVELGRALNLTVVAEGVETEAERYQLWEAGCAAGQGHLFSRAVPADQLLAELTRGVGGRPGTLATALCDEANVVRLPRSRRGERDRLVW